MLIVAIMCCSGCGSESARRPIAGTVSIDGQPVNRGSISLLPDQGHSGPAASTSIATGQYRFTETNGPTAGPHRVVIGIETDSGGMMDQEASLPSASATAKKGPADISLDPPRKSSAEPKPNRPSRTQWETKTKIPAANSPTATKPIDFVFQSDVEQTESNAKVSP